VLALVMLGVTLGATALGAFIGRRVRHLSADLSDSFGVLQGALLGVVGLILAFGLSLALSRYEDRRAAIVHEANTIGTTYLRAQTLPEPLRSRSLNLIVTYTDSAIGLSEYPPGGAEEARIESAEDGVQRRLWALAGRSLELEPVASAPRLYVETLNEMIDAQTSRVAALNNDVPAAVRRVGGAAPPYHAAPPRPPVLPPNKPHAQLGFIEFYYRTCFVGLGRAAGGSPPARGWRFSGEAMARVLGLPHDLSEEDEALAATPLEDALIGSNPRSTAACSGSRCPPLLLARAIAPHGATGAVPRPLRRRQARQRKPALGLL
jgi:hypothetical protein